jgi:hypothetical protein
MRDLADAAAFIELHLGEKAGGLFVQGVEDLMCYVRSQALTGGRPWAKPRDTFRTVSRGILADVVKAFLSEEYVSEEGHPEIYVTASGILDKDMNPIPELEFLQSVSDKILDMLVEEAVSELEAGEVLFGQISARAELFDNKYVTRSNPPPTPRTEPPTEALEIEMMRLERRLPTLSKDEGERLSHLYVILNHTVKA